MKNSWKYLLMAALVLGLSFAFTSCSDDDDDNKKSEEQKEQEAQEAQQKADAFWAVVGQLTSIDNYTADYQDKTFEPTIGEPSEGNPYVRIVATNDIASAAQRFANLVGLDSDFDPNATTYEWKNDAVGTLTYRKTDNGTSWATVDVRIKQMPHLQQIIYQSAEQGGTNGSFDGSAYYRFGDVVSRENEDGKTEYWVCVRPAFGKEGKGDSHWVTVSPLPEKNMEHIRKYDRDFYVPKGLGTNVEQMQNFAEMLYAMIHPDLWYDNVKNNAAPTLFNKGLRTFHDFSHAADQIKYHNQYFWQRVREAWDNEGLFKKVLGFDSQDENFPFYENVIYGGAERLHFLYNGYSWWSSVSDNLSLYEYTFESDTDPWELNMHRTSKREVKMDMRELRLDLKSEYTQSGPYLLKSNMFGDTEPRYIIRHATGQDLTEKSSKWDYKQPISGVKPVYVYNHYYYLEGTDGAAPNQHFRDLTIREPEVTVDNNSKTSWNRDAYNGDSYYIPGDVCIDEEGSRWFCIMNSGSAMNDDGGACLNAPYSYFISFDNITAKNGSWAPDIAVEPMLPKVMMPMLTFFNNYLMMQQPLYTKIYENIKDNTGVDLRKIALIRDSVITESDTQQQNVRPSICTSIAYLNNDKNKWQLMRIVQDGAYDKRHNRQWHYFYYTMYENTQQPILLSDIADQEKVNSYARDPWTVLPLHDSTQRNTWRTQADARATDYKNYIWNNGIPQTDATSMWNEPVLIFRVTKVYDRGGNHATMTYTGRKFTKIILSPLHKESSESMMGRAWWSVVSVGAYKSNLMTMNGKVYKWHDWNNDQDIIRE